MTIDTEETIGTGKTGKSPAARIAGFLALAAALAVGYAAYHAWNRGLLDAAREAAPDGINLEPSPGEPGAFVVNPGFEAILAVDLVESRAPTAENAPREILRLEEEAWSFDAARSSLRVKRAFDSEKYFVRVKGTFAYPLVFTLPDVTKPGSIRLIVEGKLGLEGEDYSFDAATRRLTLLGTSQSTEWFCLDYGTADGTVTINSGIADRFTRSMRAYMGYPVDGNCEAADGSGRRFMIQDAGALEGSAPWLLELLPTGEGYVGRKLWPDAFRFDPSTGIIELAEPIDADRFSVFAFAD